MTRSDVMVRDRELLDVFHDHDREHAVVVSVGGMDNGEIRVPEPSPSTIGISGYEDDLDEGAHGGTFEVRLNGEFVAEGRLDTRTGVAVTAEIGSALIEVPPGQRVEIDVYGEEVSSDG